MSKTLEYLFSGFIAIAIIAVIVSKNSTSATALQSLGAALTNIFAAIVAPISGGTAVAAAAATTAAASNSVGSATSAGVTAPTVPAAPSGVTTPNTGSTTVNQ